MLRPVKLIPVDYETTMYIPFEVASLALPRMRESGAEIHSKRPATLWRREMQEPDETLYTWMKRFERDGYPQTDYKSYAQFIHSYDPEEIYAYLQQFFGHNADREFLAEMRRDQLRAVAEMPEDSAAGGTVTHLFMGEKGLMVYNRFKNLRLSALGLGCMRLPVIDGDDSRPDQDAVNAMVEEAMASGVNYYDTAWGYHGGNSEIAVGRALRAYPRNLYPLADKVPGYDLSNFGRVEEIFEEQLKKCGVDYFDFYLCHNVCEMNIDAYLAEEKHGTMAYLRKQVENGRIRHLGFSAHGSIPVMKRFLEAYGEDMEFCQIQLNWLDWEFQDAKGKVELLNEWGIPVWVMEPLRGGKLAKLDAEDEAALKALRPDEGVPAWAFRFLQSIPGVTMVLSGMSSMEQLKENLNTCKSAKPLNEAEQAALAGIAKKMVERIALPCTACRYCTTHCPQELDIPSLLSLYNEHCFSGGGFLAPMALMAVPGEKQPSACLGCRSCEAVCPQQIKISEAMADFVAKMNG